MTDKLVQTHQNGGNHDQRDWVEPEIVVMSTSDSAAGANEVVPEGAIAMGS